MSDQRKLYEVSVDLGSEYFWVAAHSDKEAVEYVQLSYEEEEESCEIECSEMNMLTANEIIVADDDNPASSLSLIFAREEETGIIASTCY